MKKSILIVGTITFFDAIATIREIRFVGIFPNKEEAEKVGDMLTEMGQGDYIVPDSFIGQIKFSQPYVLIQFEKEAAKLQLIKS